MAGLLVVVFASWMSRSAVAAAKPVGPLLLVVSSDKPYPGGAILVTCHVATPTPVTASFAGRTFAFYPGAKPGEMKGIVGVDLELEPGVRELVVTSAGPSQITQKLPITVRKGPFPVQRLTVAERMVHPDPEAEARIAREAALLEQIFKGRSPKLFGGKFLRPVPGHETASFGGRRILNGVAKSPHSGVDMHADTGTPVRAPAPARVVLVANHYFTGNTVVLDHGLGLFTQYAHLSAFSVVEGQTVKPGDLIGKSGATGRVTGPHLHWAARLDGAKINPLDLTRLDL